MKYLSLCSGIEAASVAWEPLGWTPAVFSEIEPFCCALLKHRYPDVPNLGDMTKFKEWDIDRLGTVDLVVGGTPCQSFSVAGLRQGLDDPRGNLALVFLAILERLRPRWMLWENVPGVLSVDSGRVFGAFLGGLAQCGYGFAYRILDAQYFGVPQRRRRVFVVGYFGDWRPAAAVLLERESMCRNTQTRKEARERIAAGTVSRALSRVGGGDDPGANKGGALIASPLSSGACPSGQSGRRQEDDFNLVIHSLSAEGFDASEDGTGRGTPLVAYNIQQNDGGNHKRQDRPEGGMYVNETDTALTVGSTDKTVVKQVQWASGGGELENDTAQALRSGAEHSYQFLRTASAVRRLTPMECERLQGFPDDYTRIPYRGKPAEQCPDGPRYRSLGNSMAVPVIRWIGERIHTFSAPEATL